MKRSLNILLLLLPFTFLQAQPKAVDLIIHHARIFTVDGPFSTAEAIAIKNGKVVATGTNAVIQKKYTSAESMDAGGKFIYPGFIDAHAHFIGYGQSLQSVDLTGTKSWEEVITRVKKFAAANPEGWITGRGWDQNDWVTTEFPNNEMLNQLFPDRPVLLGRVDGHAAVANEAAFKVAGIQPGQKAPGGEIEMKNGKLTGVLIDNAIDLVTGKMPPPDMASIRKALLDAQKNCFAAGLTTVDDCGLPYLGVEAILALQAAGELKMRVYAMLSDEPANYAYIFNKGKIKTDRMNVRAFKVYADGALGSRGACLLAPYSDRPDHHGFLLSNPAHFDSVAALLHEKGFQMCTHAIGDSGNRTMLKIYGKYLKKKNDLRWRIEHAQVVNKADFQLFGKYSIIPSIQPTHATSDMYWAEYRLGGTRVKGAYALNDLLKQNGWLPLGTDFPVEDINPLYTFYAATARMDRKGYPAGGFQPENALSRKNALRGMTIWAAKSNFEEKEKGSLEPGKWADLVMLDTDLMIAPLKNIPNAKVLMTMVGGEIVFKK